MTTYLVKSTRVFLYRRNLRASWWHWQNVQILFDILRCNLSWPSIIFTINLPITYKYTNSTRYCTIIEMIHGRDEWIIWTPWVNYYFFAFSQKCLSCNKQQQQQHWNSNFNRIQISLERTCKDKIVLLVYNKSLVHRFLFWWWWFSRGPAKQIPFLPYLLVNNNDNNNNNNNNTTNSIQASCLVSSVSMCDRIIAGQVR